MEQQINREGNTSQSAWSNATTPARILITGGAGFIGSNLTEYFLSKGYFVRCLDNFATGHLYNIEPFLQNDQYELMEGDVRNPLDCGNAVAGMDYEKILSCRLRLLRFYCS